MKLTGETKFFLGIVALTIAIIIIAIPIFTKPAPILSRSDLLPDYVHTQGNKDAKVFLVEFSDFQCPACRTAKPIVDEILSKYKDKIVFGYRYFPLDQHPFGQKSAEAAEIAAQSGKFWEMGNLLFDNQDILSDETIASLAAQLGLDKNSFAKDMTDHKYKDRVAKDRDYGVQIGISATPTFYLNGQKVDLSTYADLSTAVANALK
jgi:protein-disulfide isomerase